MKTILEGEFLEVTRVYSFSVLSSFLLSSQERDCDIQSEWHAHSVIPIPGIDGKDSANINWSKTELNTKQGLYLPLINVHFVCFY